MVQSRRLLGDCPICERTLPEGRLLIEFEQRGGARTVFAECPDCDDVVNPR